MNDGAYLLERIRLQCVEDGECLIWQGGTNGKGTPLMRVPGSRSIVSVRKVVLQCLGKWKEGARATISTAKCLRPGCVADEHVMQVTRSFVNKRTAKATGYHLDPVRNAKISESLRKHPALTAEARIAILSSDESDRATAAKYEVTYHTVRELRRGVRSWQRSNPFAGLGART